MRSRRSLFESACRLLAFALLGWLLGIALVPSAARRVERANADVLASRLPAWTRAAARTAMHVDVARVPRPWETAWLAALRRAGRPVTWSGTPAAIAVAADPLVDPAGAARIDVAAPKGARVIV